MRKIIPLDIDTSRWKTGVYVNGNVVRKLMLGKWLKRHDKCYAKYPKSRVRFERSDGLRIFIMAACQRCVEFYITDDLALPLPTAIPYIDEKRKKSA